MRQMIYTTVACRAIKIDDEIGVVYVKPIRRVYIYPKTAMMPVSRSNSLSRIVTFSVLSGCTHPRIQKKRDQKPRRSTTTVKAFIKVG